MSNYGITSATAPTPGNRPYGTPFSVPFAWQDQPRWAPHLKDIVPHPALPIIRSLSAGGFPDGRWDDGVVIDVGEPVGVYRDPVSQINYLVPCARGTTGWTATYSAYDVAQGTEDLDTPGVRVASAKTTSARFPNVLPIGVAQNPVIRNFNLTTEQGPFSAQYANYSPDLKPVVCWDGVAVIPWYRYGPKQVQDPDSGDIIVPGILSNLSATNRPFFTTANFTPVGAGNVTAATATITVAAGNGLLEDETLSIHQAGNTYTLKVVDASPDLAAGEFIVGGDDDATAANIKATLDVLIPSSAFTAAVTTNVVTITSAISGGEGNFTFTGALTDVTPSGTAATSNGSDLELTGNALALKNLAFKMGRIIQVIPNLAEWGDAPSLALTMTTPGMGLSGRDTGGVPANLRAAGNSPHGNVVPADWRDAGALRILIHL